MVAGGVTALASVGRRGRARLASSLLRSGEVDASHDYAVGRHRNMHGHHRHHYWQVLHVNSPQAPRSPGNTSQIPLLRHSRCIPLARQLTFSVKVSMCGSRSWMNLVYTGSVTLYLFLLLFCLITCFLCFNLEGRRFRSRLPTILFRFVFAISG